MYNSAKAAQIIAYLALKHEKRAITMLKAVKLVYIADRESIREFAYPMLDEQRVSMTHGPVNSTTYDMIKGRQSNSEWSAILKGMTHAEVPVIHVQDNITTDDLDELSDAEIAILDSVWEKFQHMDRWAMRDWTHQPGNIPEWRNPGTSSRKIDLETILKATGHDAVEELSSHIADQQQIDDIFARLQNEVAR